MQFNLAGQSNILLLLMGLGVALLLVLMIAGVTVYMMRFSPRARLRRRIDIVGGKAVRPDKSDKGSGSKRKLIQARLIEIEENQKKKSNKDSLRARITQAGLNITPQNYYVFSGIAAAVAAGGYLTTGFMAVGAILVAIPAGLLLPKMVLNFLINRRRKKFTSLFAQAVDVIVRGIQSGLPVNECLVIIAREMPDPVGYEFRQITEGQKIGLTLDEALNRALERVPTADFRFFGIVLNIQQQTGGNLAETLGNLSGVLRDRKKMADKVRAMSSEAKSTAMIIGSLPFIMGLLIYATSPDYIMHLFTDPMGHMLIGAGIVLMSTGSFIMKQMISFEI